MKRYAHFARWTRIVLIALAVAMLASACAKPKEAAAPTGAASPAKTAKPTFTPQQPASAKPTAAPTTAQQAAAVPTTVPPTSVQTKPTDAAVAATAVPPTATVAPPTPTMAAPAPKGPRMASPEYGMQAFMWWRPEVASRDLQKISEAGFTWVKVNFGWRDIEGAGKGQFDWSHTDKILEMTTADGIDVLARVDNQPQWAGGGYPLNGPPDNLQDLADFMGAMAKRYKGRIRAYEVWNEPNLAREWGGKLPDPGVYVKMLKLCYGAVKAADPNAMIVSAGLSPTGTWNTEARPDDWYLKSMYVAMGGPTAGYFDVLGAHAPGFKYSPETDPAVVAKDSHGQRAFCFRHVEDLHAIMVENGDTNRQIAVLEFGWTSDPRPDSPYNWHAVTEQTKADYLVRAYQYAKANWSPWIGMMSLIYVCDPDWTKDQEQYYWAINDPNYPEFKARPAYTALKNMAK